MNDYFKTDKPHCPIYNYEMYDNLGISLGDEDDGIVKIENDVKLRENNVTNTDWQPKLRIKGN